MQTLVLEGIATSGKSTIIGMLETALSRDKTVKVVPETETIMVMEQNTDAEASKDHLKELIRKAYEKPHDIVIFDRLYLTHIFRTHSTIHDFKEIEEILKAYNPTTIYLKVDEGLIAGRVEKASQHRDSTWKEYISTKGRTFSEIADYYIGQQRNQLKLLAESSLPHKIYDTSDHSYEVIVRGILAGID